MNDQYQQNAPNSEKSIVPRAEFFTLAGIAAAAGLGVNSGEKLLKVLNSPDPIVLQVLKSGADGSSHQIEFKVTNQTLHGAYVERLRLIRPDVKIKAIKPPNVSFGWDSSRSVADNLSEVFPWYIPPGGDATFTTEFSLQSETDFSSKAYGELELEISQLDEKASSRRKLDFRLRWNKA